MTGNKIAPHPGAPDCPADMPGEIGRPQLYVWQAFVTSSHAGSDENQDKRGARIAFKQKLVKIPSTLKNVTRSRRHPAWGNVDANPDKWEQMGDFTRYLADEMAIQPPILAPTASSGRRATRRRRRCLPADVAAPGLQTRGWRADIASTGRAAPAQRLI